MCTLSWILHNHGYEVFFNRDEQRTRQKATQPTLDKITGAIMPIDPDGKGTWITSNLSGLTLCLLNNYQKQAEMDTNINYQSRGQLVRELIENQQIKPADFFLHIKSLHLKNYLPFFLCVFPDDLSRNTNSINILQWDGQRLTKELAIQPFISSGVLLSQVLQTRGDAFKKLTGGAGNSRGHINYHSSHLPEKGFSSVCMHREDARTQSLTHITVSNDIVFRYHDGPPCEDNKWSEIKAIKQASYE